MTEHKHKLPWLIACGFLMENLDVTVINTSIPQMAQHFAVNPLMLKLAITGYLLSLVLFMPVSGYFADRFGTKRVFMSAIAVFIFGSLLCALSPNLSTLVAARMIQGLGGAMLTPTGRLILIQNFEKSAMVKAISRMAVIAQMGPAIGPTLGGALTTYLSWHWIFIINLPIGLTGLILAYRWIEHNNREKTNPFDITGFLMFGLSLVGINVFLVFANNPQLPFLFSVTSLVVGLVVLCAYFKYTRQKRHPMIDFSPFQTRTFKISVLGSLWIRITANSLPFVLPLLFQIGFNYSALASGLFLLFYGAGLIGAKFYFEALLTRLGYRRMLLITPCIIALIVIAFSLLEPGSSVTIIAALCFIAGLACSTLFSLMQTLNYVDIPVANKSKATSLASLCQQLAVNFAICSSAFLLESFNAAHDPATISLQAFHHTLIVLALVAASSTLVFQLLKKTDGQSALQA